MGFRGCFRLARISSPDACKLNNKSPVEKRGPPAVRRTRSGRWLRRRTRSTASSRSTSSSRGPSASCPSGSGRSTSTGCTRTSGSSCRSWSRRCSSGTCRGRGRPRSVRRLGHDARAVARERPRRDRRRRRRLQLSADARQDGAVQPRSRSSTSCATRCGGSRLRRNAAAAADRYVALVRAAAARRARPFRSLDRRVRARGRAARRARARRALGAPDDALRPRFPARAAGRRVLVPQAQARRAARSSARRTSCAATRSTRSRGSRRSRACARAGRGGRPPRRRARARARRPVRRGRHLAAVPGPDRLPRAAPLRVRAARARRPARARARRGRAGRAREGDRATTWTGSRRCSRTCAASLDRGAPVVIVVNDRRELYPEILERAGSRLEKRLRRHVNRRTGRRAGEYFEDVLVAR